MARRTKGEEKYNDRLYLRCMSEQKARIKTKATQSGLNTNSFALEMLLNGEVVVNDNSISFFELSLIHQLQSVGQWLNKSFTHRANITGDISNEISNCLREVERLLNYVSFSLKMYDEYVWFCKGEDSEEGKEYKYPLAIHPKLAFQLHGLDNNLTQLNNIAKLRDIRPRELSVCIEKVSILLNRIS